MMDDKYNIRTPNSDLEQRLGDKVGLMNGAKSIYINLAYQTFLK
jgi:hypothetical protein